MNRLNKDGGFTLVELMIVLVIVAILSAVAVPIYTSQVMKAKMSEADAALGTIRTELRVYYGENGDYPTVAVAAAVIGQSWNDIQVGELIGKYFVDADYTYVSADGVSYTLTCVNNAGELNSNRTLDQAGTLAGGI